jgi:SAM-dependent MidA family methyltransferase
VTLHQRLIEQIQRKGPLSVAAYMDFCLYDETEGFYTTTHKLTDHFVTAPEISQLFAEMLAIHLVLKWEQFGKPASVSVIELGPGHGTLARDMTRLLTQYMGPQVQLSYILVEKSPKLKAHQEAALSEAPCPVLWADWDQALALSHASGCVMFVANEFFDAMPVHQYEKVEGVWQERKIAWDAQGGLMFTYAPVSAQVNIASSQTLASSEFTQETTLKIWDPVTSGSTSLESTQNVASNALIETTPFNPGSRIPRLVTQASLDKPKFRDDKEKDTKAIIFPKTGDFYECSPQSAQWFEHIISVLSFQPGAAVIIDYGYETPTEGYQDTLQALFQHKMVDPLTLCGQADLTAHVDFGHLMTLNTHPQISTQLLCQQDFLLQHGLMLRLERLMEGKSIAQRTQLAQGAERLVAPDQMGILFKVLLCESI